MLRGNAGEGDRMVRVCATVSADRLDVEVGDDGPGFDLEGVQASPADGDWLEREDGRGIFLMRHLMDAVECLPRPAGGRHCVRLRLLRQ
jgi:serine/threonine-protein kinase RsbW